LANEWSGLLDDDKPSPVSERSKLPEVPLNDLHELPLVILFLVDLPLNVSQALTLEPPDQFQHNVVTIFLKTSQSTSSEEDFGVAKTISISGEINLVHQGIDTSLVVRRAGNLFSTQNCVPRLEVRIKHPVGEASHTNPDALKHTITGELMHNELRLNSARLFVSIGHNATDEVGLSVMQSVHKFSQLDQVDRCDSFGAATLLLLLGFVFIWGRRLSRMVSP
jgi:hypothetical protein